MLTDILKDGGLSIVSGRSDCHMVVVGLRPKYLTGKMAEAALSRAGLTCNKNAIPFDPAKPAVTSGIRTPPATTLGFGREEWSAVGRMSLDVVEGWRQSDRAVTGLWSGGFAGRSRRCPQGFPIYADAGQ
jgi:glycine hydroxymethyltransferase